MSQHSPYAYIARKPECGCVVGAQVENGEKVGGDTLREWFIAGFIIERVYACEVDLKPIFDGCPHEPKQMSMFSAQASL